MAGVVTLICRIPIYACQYTVKGCVACTRCSVGVCTRCCRCGAGAAKGAVRGVGKASRGASKTLRRGSKRGKAGKRGRRSKNKERPPADADWDAESFFSTGDDDDYSSEDIDAEADESTLPPLMLKMDRESDRPSACAECGERV